MLADLLRDGELRAMAEQQWSTNEKGVQFKQPHDDAFESQRSAEIPAQVWRLTRRWSADQERWRWPRGNFFVTAKFAPRERIFLKHVHFDRKEILRTHKRAAEMEEKLKRGGGRVTPADHWAIIAEALLKLDRLGELSKTKFGTAESLAYAILSDPKADVLGRTVLVKFCSHIVRSCLR